MPLYHGSICIHLILCWCHIRYKIQLKAQNHLIPIKTNILWWCSATTQETASKVARRNLTEGLHLRTRILGTDCITNIKVAFSHQEKSIIRKQKESASLSESMKSTRLEPVHHQQTCKLPSLSCSDCKRQFRAKTCLISLQRIHRSSEHLMRIKVVTDFLYETNHHKIV